MLEEYLAEESAAFHGAYDPLLWKQIRRKRMIKAGILTAAVIVTAVVGGNHWNRFVPKIRYYTDYVDVNGIPQGIGDAVSLQRQKDSCAYYYSIVTLDGKVDAIRLVNIEGKPVDPLGEDLKEEPAIREFIYDDSGNLSEIVWKGVDGKEQKVLDYDGIKNVSLRNRKDSDSVLPVSDNS